MKINIKKLLVFTLSLAMLVGIGSMFQTTGFAAPPADMPTSNPFYSTAQYYTNPSFAWPSAPVRTGNASNPTWTEATWRSASQVIHDTGIYYENGVYYGAWTNDTGIYTSTDMHNWTRSGLRPYGWRNNEPLHVTWAPEIIELRQPYVWPMDGSNIAGMSFKYAMWDSLSIFGQPASRIRCWVTNNLTPTYRNGRGTATATNWTTVGLNNVLSAAGPGPNHGMGIPGAGAVDGWHYVGDSIGCGRYATATPNDTWTNNDAGSGNPRPAGEVIDGFATASQYYVLSGQTLNASGGSTNFNTIDSNIIYDQSGKMWMSWGSWTNGIWICELNPATLKPYSNAVSSYTQIARIGSEEGPNIIYRETAPGDGWYYLCLARNGLMDSYNSKVFRSRNVTGPYVDANGTSATANNSNTGTKVAGPYNFGTATSTGWLAQGHIQWCYNPDIDEWFIVSNGRPANSSGSARQMIRSVLWTESGWPLFSPARSTPDQVSSIRSGGNVIQAAAKVPSRQTVPTDMIAGTYQTILHRRSSTRTTALASVNLTLHDDYTITGSINSATADTGTVTATGYWAQTTPTQVAMRINGIDYEAVFTSAWDWENNGANGYGLVFAALSQAGAATNDAYGAVLWGKQVPPVPPVDVVAAAKAALTIPSVAYADIALPSTAVGAGNTVAVTWQTNNAAALSDTGVVNRGAADVTVTMTATLTYKGVTDTKVFQVLVPLLPYPPTIGANPNVLMRFENDYNNYINGNNIRHTQALNAQVGFTAGKFGQGLTMGTRRTGDTRTSSLRLIDNVIPTSNEFTFSMWVNGSTFYDHTASLFVRAGTASPNNKWFAIQPRLASGQNAGFRLCDDNSGSSVWYDLDSGIRLNTGTWYMLTVVYDNGKLDMYVNGVWRAGIASGVPNPRGTGTMQTWVGGSQWDGTFAGAMDDLYLFTRALNADQIAYMYSVDKSALLAALNDFPANYTEAYYPPALWLASVNARVSAQTVYNDANATPMEVTNVTTDLLNGLAAMKTAALQAALDDFPDNYIENRYLSASWAAAADARLQVQDVYDNQDATTAQVEQALGDMFEAIANLEEVIFGLGSQPASVVLRKGMTYQININTNNLENIFYVSGNTNATVSTTGLVTAMKTGSAVITVIDVWAQSYFTITINITS